LESRIVYGGIATALVLGGLLAAMLFLGGILAYASLVLAASVVLIMIGIIGLIGSAIGFLATRYFYIPLRLRRIFHQQKAL
jgi:hypothetical protein